MRTYTYEIKNSPRTKSIPSIFEITIQKIGNINYILFTDVNIGISVTNISEELATEIIELENLNPRNCRFFERYSWEYRRTVTPSHLSKIENEGWAEVKYGWYKNKATNAEWKPVNNNILDIFSVDSLIKKINIL